ERALLVVAGDDVLPQFGSDGLEQIAGVPDHREVAQDRAPALEHVMDCHSGQGRCRGGRGGTEQGTHGHSVTSGPCPKRFEGCSPSMGVSRNASRAWGDSHRSTTLTRPARYAARCPGSTVMCPATMITPAQTRCGRGTHRRTADGAPAEPAVRWLRWVCGHAVGCAATARKPAESRSGGTINTTDSPSPVRPHSGGCTHAPRCGLNVLRPMISPAAGDASRG